MEIYLVGGAVRDELLGRPVIERDWVVIGASVEEMIKLGYRPVGKDFPVFLHPKTKEEYALARTERKTAPGYKGFNFYAAPDVTLEDDLKRRDLTINAIAKDAEGNLIDPFGGRNDLTNKILRHVSPAFSEDPVRILRVARFAARFADFAIHPVTLQLMQEIVHQGEINALVAERVWQEWSRGLKESHPWRFFEVLADCQALPILFPELINNFKGIAALKNTVSRDLPLEIRFAALLYTLAATSIRALSQRYRIPRNFTDLALLVAQYFSDYQQLSNKDAESLLSLLESLDAFRRPERLEQFLQTCDTIADEVYPSKKSLRLQEAYSLAKSVDPTPIVLKGYQGKDIGAVLRAAQLTLIQRNISSAFDI